MSAASPLRPRPRPRPRPRAERVCLVLMGDPAPVGVSGPRTLVRQCPSTRIPSPSPAAAAACLSTTGPPAFSARAAPRVARPRARRGSPVPRDASHHDPSAATPVSPALRVSAPCGFLSVGGIAPIRALPRMWRTVPCDASTAYAAALQHGTGSSPLGDAITPGSSVPARRLWRPSDAGHSSIASPRRHQLFPYRNACRQWPGGRFSAPSLPESRCALRRSCTVHAACCDYQP